MRARTGSLAQCDVKTTSNTPDPHSAQT